MRDGLLFPPMSNIILAGSTLAVSPATAPTTSTNTAIQTERQTDKWDFEVEQVKLFTPDGLETQFYGNRRTDTKQVLGVVTDQYQLMQNRDLFGACESLFEKKGYRAIKSKSVVTGDGARIRSMYSFPDLGIRIRGQEMSFNLVVQNSFDGSLRVSFKVGLFRFICSNGLAVPFNAINLTAKHTAKLDMDFTGRGLDHAVREFTESAPMFERMIDTKVEQNLGLDILNGLTRKKILSQVQNDSIARIWNAPTYKEDAGRNLFNLYNASTQYLTHEVEGKRFELADRTNSQIVGAFAKAVKSGSLASLLN